MIKREKRPKSPKRELNRIAPKKKTIDWLKPALRSSIHEFNQAITAFGFTASSLSLLAQQIEPRNSKEIKSELIELSEQMKEAELRYKQSVQVLDFLTTSGMRAEKISLSKSFEAVNELFQTYLRKHKIQIAFDFKEDVVVECFPDKLYRVWAFLMISLAEQKQQELASDTAVSKVKVELKEVQKDVILKVQGKAFGVAIILFSELIKEFDLLGKVGSKGKVEVNDGHCKLNFIFSK